MVPEKINNINQLKKLAAKWLKDAGVVEIQLRRELDEGSLSRYD